MAERSIAISAGEASGDLNGAYLTKSIAQIMPDVYFWGAGGQRMREAGVDIVANMAGGGTIGVAESLKSLPAIAVKYHKLRHLLLKRKPDLFIPIDFGAFNIRLAQIAYARQIPVVYYFPPSSWRKVPRNSDKLIACGGKVITPFPWSAELLTQAGLDARFVGHPLLDIVTPTASRDQFLSELGLDPSFTTIGLLPGSRSHEISGHTGPMVESMDIIHRELGRVQFVVGAAWGSEKIRRHIMRVKKNDAVCVRVVEGRTYDCMAASDLLITASGTATLEAAILGVPMIIIYRGSAVMRFEYIMRKAILESYIGMPNIIAGREVCPELIAKEVTGEKIADIALGWLADERALARIRNELKEVRACLGDIGAVDRAARAALEMGELL
ncbi:MAG: lipid-A-disaccharide synthase [Armatimonadetes bacterium]|jgi:lipid-A-disaccharide synthase|nr:lipid-A-disaccharide synthase [Armatimonadota bacterium]